MHCGGLGQQNSWTDFSHGRRSSDFSVMVKDGPKIKDWFCHARVSRPTPVSPWPNPLSSMEWVKATSALPDCGIIKSWGLTETGSIPTDFSHGGELKLASDTLLCFSVENIGKHCEGNCSFEAEIVTISKGYKSWLWKVFLPMALLLSMAMKVLRGGVFRLNMMLLRDTWLVDPVQVGFAWEVCSKCWRQAGRSKDSGMVCDNR